MTLPDDAKRKIEARYPCDAGQAITMESGKTYDETRKANYHRRQGAEWMALESQREIAELKAKIEADEEVVNQALGLGLAHKINLQYKKQLSDAESQMKELRETAEKLEAVIMKQVVFENVEGDLRMWGRNGGDKVPAQITEALAAYRNLKQK